MNPPSSAPFLASRAAVRFGAVFLACIGAVAVFSIADGARRHESFSQTTAVEDRRFYVPPNPSLAVPEPVVTWQGHPVAPVNYEKQSLHDADMVRAGRDESTGLGIYSNREKPGPLYIKIGLNAYLRLNAS